MTAIAQYVIESIVLVLALLTPALQLWYQVYCACCSGSGYESAREMAADGIARAKRNFQEQQASAAQTGQEAKDSAAQAADDTAKAATKQVRTSGSA